jgi:hypothetical protein
MNATTSFRAAPLRVAMVAALLSPGLVAAQFPATERVRVAIPDRFPLPDARAVVLRYGSSDKPDVIILESARATPEALSAAVALLQTLRKQRTVAPGRYAMAVVKGFAPLRELSPQERTRLAAQLSQLRAGRVSRIGNLGPGRWGEFEYRLPRS